MQQHLVDDLAAAARGSSSTFCSSYSASYSSEHQLASLYPTSSGSVVTWAHVKYDSIGSGSTNGVQPHANRS